MKTTSRSKRFKLTLMSTLFVLLSIPMVMYALLATDSTDTRSRADEYEDQLCTISFPFINPQTVQAGALVNIEIKGIAPEGESITGIKVWIEDSDLLDQLYDEPQKSIAHMIKFTTEDTGLIAIMGLMHTDKSSYVCQMIGSDNNTISAQSLNNAPQFKTEPSSAVPSNSLKVGDSYRYELIAEDPDGDNIEYSYSFTPRADWLTMSVVKDDQQGNLTLLFEGVTDQPASYLANVFIHDGYNRNLNSQSWVISVDPAENDTPIVNVHKPVSQTTVVKGEPLSVGWTATDQNQIVAYRLYYANNPGNENSWKSIDENISYRTSVYEVDTNTIEPGNYKVIVQAQDNQSPPAIGSGISEQFSVVSTPGQEPIDPDSDDQDDDGVVLQEPQIVNINPTDKSTTLNLTQTISATLIAGTNADIVMDSILIKVDGVDMTANSEINQLSTSEVTLIYPTSKEYEEGEHKVDIYFEDGNGDKASRQWSFIIKEEMLDDGQIEILGFRVSSRTFWIIVIGLALIILAIAVPWVIYLIWRNNDEEIEDSAYTIPPSYPTLSDTVPMSPDELIKERLPTIDESIKAKEEATTRGTQESKEVEESSAEEINTLTQGIIRNPQFQKLDDQTRSKKEDGNKQAKQKQKDDTNSSKHVFTKQTNMNNTDDDDKEQPTVWKPRVIIPPKDNE